MVSVLASSVVDRGFEPRTVQAKDYKIGICCFSAKHAANNSHIYEMRAGISSEHWCLCCSILVFCVVFCTSLFVCESLKFGVTDYCNIFYLKWFRWCL